MTKPKKTENSKKANHSEPKAKESGLAKTLKDLAEKVVSTAKTIAPAKVAAPAKAKAAAPKAPPAAKDDSKSVEAKPAKAAKTKSTPAVLSAATVVAEVAVKAPPPAALAEIPMDLEDTEVFLTDAEGRRYCRATDCDQVGLVDGYCRYHYLYFWKKIQVRKKILADGKLERYIEELTARYVDKFIELLRKDLRTEKDFMAAVQELELDDSAASSQQDEDEAKNYLEEISGVASESNSRDEDSY